METKICDKFIPRNATMQYALSDCYERIRLKDHLKEIQSEIRYADSIASLLNNSDLSDTQIVQAVTENIKTLNDVISHLDGDFYMLLEYGFCTAQEKKQALQDRNECVKNGSCDGKCKVCNDGWAVGGECKCNIIGSDGYAKSKTTLEKGEDQNA